MLMKLVVKVYCGGKEGLMKLVVKVYCAWPADTTSHVLVDMVHSKEEKCLDCFYINYVTVTLGSFL